jgi:hypothetical protein
VATEAVVELCAGEVFQFTVYGAKPPDGDTPTVAFAVFDEQLATGGAFTETEMAEDVAEQPPLLTTTV